MSPWSNQLPVLCVFSQILWPQPKQSNSIWGYGKSNSCRKLRTEQFWNPIFIGFINQMPKKMAEAILKMRTWYNNIIFDLTTDSCRNNLVIPFDTSNQVVSAAAINSPVGWPPGEAPHANRRSCGAQRRIPRIWSTWVRQVNAVVQWGICQFFGH